MDKTCTGTAAWLNWFAHSTTLFPALCLEGFLSTGCSIKAALLFFSSLLLLCSPFGGIAFLPYLAAAIYPDKSFFSDMFRSWNARSFFLTASACGIVLVTALFMSGAGSMNVLLLFQKETDESMILLGRTIIFLAANLVIPAILLYPVFRKSSMFWITICGFAACTLIYVGVRYNELVFKTSGVFFFFLAIYVHRLFPCWGKFGNSSLLPISPSAAFFRSGSSCIMPRHFQSPR